MTLKQLKEYRSLTMEIIMQNESTVPDHDRLRDLLRQRKEIECFIKEIPQARARAALGVYCGLYPPFQNNAAVTWRDVAITIDDGTTTDALKKIVQRAVKKQNAKLSQL